VWVNAVGGKSGQGDGAMQVIYFSFNVSASAHVSNLGETSGTECEILPAAAR
jgi:hypothetical protein